MLRVRFLANLHRNKRASLHKNSTHFTTLCLKKASPTFLTVNWKPIRYCDIF